MTESNLVPLGIENTHVLYQFYKPKVCVASVLQCTQRPTRERETELQSLSNGGNISPQPQPEDNTTQQQQQQV